MRPDRFAASSGAVVCGAFAALLLAERCRPLRRRVEPGLAREARNLAVAAASALAIRLVERPLVEPLAHAAVHRRRGLLQRRPLPAPLEAALALALLDFTLYLWHILTHRVPFLWRFHLVHHVDLDLTASTALRFHFAEMMVSVPWRAAQVALIGVRPQVLRLWQTATLVEIMFHHSNLHLPLRLERRLGRLIVTPRMHGIHHANVREQTHANWSSGLTVWDWLFGTLRLDVPQEAITIGVPAYRRAEALTLPRLLAMPFRRQPPSWQERSEDRTGGRS
ncbi:MAG TPA: sterol desaturase family protein [Stellaceae bacterium]|nr:sterol desaturase family protein [Stellaceae bacterium]